MNYSRNTRHDAYRCQFTFIFIALYAIQIVAEQLNSDKQKNSRIGYGSYGDSAALKDNRVII